MNTWIDLAGWTLLHFLWQGTLAAAAGAVALRLLRAASPHARYAAACATLAAMLAAPVATLMLLKDAGPPAAGAANAGPLTVAVAPTAATVPPGAPRTGAEAGRTDSAPAAGTPALRWNALLPFVVAGWLCGVVILLARLGGGYWRVRRLYRAALEEPPSGWHDAGERVAQRLGIARAIAFVDCARVGTPTVIGWIRPIVLLPAAALASLTTAQVEAILAHELAHVRRHDFAVNLLQAVAETLLFYHPAVWWISARIRAEREHCCDDVAVDVCGDAVAYAAALTEIASWSVARHHLAMAATSGSLLARVRRLLIGPAPGSRRPSVAVSLVAAVGFVLLVGSVRMISVAQTADNAPAPGGPAGFGPRDLNRVLGFELLPGPRVRPTEDPRGIRAWGVTVEFQEGRMALLGFTARSLIRDAYDLVGIPVVAPEWIDLETHDITVPADFSLEELRTDPDAVRAPLRRLLEEQLGLRTHVESRVFPVYALVRANADGSLGPLLRPSSAVCYDGEALRNGIGRAPGTPICGFDDRFSVGRGLRMTMAQLAEEMDGTGPTGLPLNVVDRTGLSGAYDLEIRLGPAPLTAMATLWSPARALLWPFGIRTIHQALPEQLGLKLEESTASFDVLVIDNINKPAT